MQRWPAAPNAAPTSCTTRESCDTASQQWPGTAHLVDGVFLVGVWQDDSVVLGSHVALHSLPIGRASLVDVLAHSVRPHKGDGANGGMVTHKVHS